MLFRSIAASRDDGCAIIMSGSGADGSLGVRAIKEAGGVVVVNEQQRPCDIKYVEVNAAFERQTGLRNVEGKTIRSLVPDLEAY